MVPTRTIRHGLLAVAAFALVAISPVGAQEVSEAHLAAARAAVGAIESTEQFDNILLNAATQVKADMIGNNPDIQTEISDMVDNAALALAPRRADLENEIARIYTKLFTEQELGQIAAFYGSEAGKKLIRQGPIATREMLLAADVWSNGIVRDLQASAAKGMVQLLPPASAVAPTTEPVAPAGTADATPAPTSTQ